MCRDCIRSDRGSLSRSQDTEAESGRVGENRFVRCRQSSFPIYTIDGSLESSGSSVSITRAEDKREAKGKQRGRKGAKEEIGRLRVGGVQPDRGKRVISCAESGAFFQTRGKEAMSYVIIRYTPSRGSC